ncbi:MAG: TlpA disulfide reductase family protein [Bacteroidota bacterium]
MNFSKILVGIIIAVMAFFVGRKFYFTPNFVNGETAVNFTGTLPNGETMQLTDLSGKYVLLDFWGSWCGPCRAENPKLVELYQKFNGKTFRRADDFEIVSVGIETDKKRWMKAIDKDNLYWKYHVSELDRFNSKIAELYGVREIPTKFLLNEKGVIVGVNQSVEQMTTYLEGQLQ